MPRGESPSPTELRHELTSIQTLEQQLTEATVQAKETNDPTEARRLYTVLQEQMQALQEKLNPFEARIHVLEQYESQRHILERLGILETFTKGEHAGKKGIRDINGQEHPLPTYQEINRRMVEHRETLKPKIEQGFVKLLITPFGRPIAPLIETYKRALQKHFDDKQLFHTKQNQDDSREMLKPITTLRSEERRVG